MNEFLKTINNSPIIIIAGPTASGKSEFAIDLAKEVSGTIINFDSMQVYKELKILSARPNRHYCKIIPHKLYGFLDADFPCSALYWRDMALIKIKESLFKGRTPILVGGTGLYIKSLLDGIDGVPKSLPEYRIKAEKTFKEEGSKKFYDIVKSVDPSIADRISANDKQRLIRNYSIWIQTGKTLYDWQNQANSNKKFFKNFIKVRLYPDRKIIRGVISERFYKMVADGAVDEVQALKGKDLSLPIMKAHGVRELLAFSSGGISFEEAASKTITNIRQYAKRQDTWFNNKYIADYKITNYRTNLNLHIKKILNLYDKLY